MLIIHFLEVCPGTQRDIDKLGRKRILRGIRLGELIE